MTTRKTILCLLVLGLTGCATAPEQGEPVAPQSTATPTSGEAGEPRNRARVHTELASLYYERGNMGVALEELRIAAEADPTYAVAHNMFGLVYMNLRENQLAERSFERALKLAPGDADINHNYGWFLCQTKRESDSLKFFMTAIRNPLYPTPWRSYAAAGICSMRTKNFKEAEDYFSRALQIEPDEPVSLLQLGQIRYQQGKFEDARRFVQRFNRLVSPSSESLWLAVRVERKLGERVAEQSFANQLRRNFPQSPEYQRLQRGEFD